VCIHVIRSAQRLDGSRARGAEAFTVGRQRRDGQFLGPPAGRMVGRMSYISKGVGDALSHDDTVRSFVSHRV